jgi:hypothetical protein
MGDPVKSDTLFAAILGARGGVFLSENSGASWDNVSGLTFGQPGGADLVTGALTITLSAFNDGRHEAIYAAVLDADKAQSGGALVRCDASLPSKHQCASIVGDHTRSNGLFKHTTKFGPMLANPGAIQLPAPIAR